jgi:hypothetical protein
MSRVLNLSGDYRIRVLDGGNIILDPGSSGTVTITGNLDVVGTRTNIESTTVSIQDNIIQVNYDPSNVYNGDGIPTAPPINGQGGMQIWRGSRPSANFLFDETLPHYNPYSNSSVAGSFTLRTADGTPSAMLMAGIVTPSNSNFVFDMQNQPFVLRVVNASGYENRILNDNDITTRKYVQQYVQNAAGTIAVSALWYPTVGLLADATSSVQAFASSIVFQLGGITKVSLSSGGFTMGNITVLDDLISNTVSNINNLKLGANTGKVEIVGALTLDDQVAQPSVVNGTTNVYSSATIGPGKTGIYFNNNNASQTPDELVSRSRAVALSILL